MMPLAMVLATLVAAGESSANVQTALSYMRGDVSAARRESSAALANGPTDAGALFVRSCLELESDGPAAAEPFLVALERLPSPPAHAAVLRQLSTRRRNVPSEPIVDALSEAWKVAGRPDLSVTPLLSSGWIDDLVPPLPGGSRLPPDVELVFTWPEPARRLALALAAAERADGNSLVVNLDILAAVMPGRRVASTPETKAVAERVGRAVAAADPSNGYLALAAWLASGAESEPLTAADLALLEAAIAAPRFEVPRRALLQQLRALAATIGPRYAELRARIASLGTPLPVFRIWQRAEATKDPALIKRSGIVMQVVAARFACSGTVLERMVGAVLAGKGAKLTGSPDGPSVRQAQDALQQWREAMSDAQKRLGEWPFGAAVQELDPALEIARYERLVGPMPSPRVEGFYCTPADGLPPERP